jgi:hypothetical protein
LVWKRNGGTKNLAKDAGINKEKLKTGFKQVYGKNGIRLPTRRTIATRTTGNFMII